MNKEAGVSSSSSDEEPAEPTPAIEVAEPEPKVVKQLESPPKKRVSSISPKSPIFNCEKVTKTPPPAKPLI